MKAQVSLPSVRADPEADMPLDFFLYRIWCWSCREICAIPQYYIEQEAYQSLAQLALVRFARQESRSRQNFRPLQPNRPSSPAQCAGCLVVALAQATVQANQVTEGTMVGSRWSDFVDYGLQGSLRHSSWPSKPFQVATRLAVNMVSTSSEVSACQESESSLLLPWYRVHFLREAAQPSSALTLASVPPSPKSCALRDPSLIDWQRVRGGLSLKSQGSR